MYSKYTRMVFVITDILNVTAHHHFVTLGLLTNGDSDHTEPSLLLKTNFVRNAI